MKACKKFIAEFLGTLFLVFFACGIAASIDASIGRRWFNIIVPLGFGLALIACTYTIGNISGSHINPSVSIAMLIDGRMNFGEFAGYIISQFLGAIAGAAILAAFVPTTSLGANYFNPFFLSSGKVVLREIILTCMFVYTVMCTTKKSDFPGAGIVNGLALTIVHILGYFFSGKGIYIYSVNPARTFGPALIKALQGDSAAMSQYWVFLVAPLAGGVLAAIIYKLLHKRGCEKK